MEVLTREQRDLSSYLLRGMRAERLGGDSPDIWEEHVANASVSLVSWTPGAIPSHEERAA